MEELDSGIRGDGGVLWARVKVVEKFVIGDLQFAIETVGGKGSAEIRSMTFVSAILDDLNQIPLRIMDLEIMKALAVLLDLSHVNAASRHHVSHSADFLRE
jgi:hypothetical protein